MKRFITPITFYSMLIIFIMVMNLKIYSQSPQLVYSTIIGGSGWDYGHAISVDDSGCAYISGQANSANYPTTTGALDRTANGGSDILISKLNKEGSALVYSSYIGGGGRDDTRKVFVDKSGCVYLTGSTASSNFPLTDGSISGTRDKFFLKLDSTGNHLEYSSRWGGGEKIMVDAEGYLIILGRTNSPTFPTTENAYSRTLAGGDDLFVAKIDLTNNVIIFSTLIGGDSSEWAPSFSLDSENNIIITGQTSSSNFPIVGNSHAEFISGKSNVFVTKLKSDGTQLIYSTIIGGSDNDWSFDITTDINNNSYVTGVTLSNDFPVSTTAFDNSYNGGQDAFLFKISEDGSEILYSTYIGGTEKDGGRGVVVGENGKVYLTGCTKSTDFPVSSDAYDTSFNGAGSDQWAWGDPFLLVMNAEGTQIEYSTYLGGSADEEAYGIAMDNRGNIYLCGITNSNNFPTTEGAYDRTLSGSCNIYVTKFQFANDNPVIDYLGQTPPGDTAEIFAGGIVSNANSHNRLVISPDGKEIFWNVVNFTTGEAKIYCATFRDGRWSDPEIPSFAADGLVPSVLFSPDGEKLFFDYRENVDNSSWQTKYVVKTDSGWSEPKSDGFLFNSSSSFTTNGRVYYSGSMENTPWGNGIYSADYSETGLSNVDPLPESINARNIINYSPYIAPDESFLLFSSNRPITGNNDTNMYLYVSFNNNGVWSTPQKINNAIGFSGKARLPSISPDGKYLFFCADDRNYYWVNINTVKILNTADINESNTIPDGFNLNQNYPNPFNPSTNISYQLHKSCNVTLKIYDILGREIKTLVDSFQNTGEHSIVWNGRSDSNSSVCSGMYFYSLKTGTTKLQKKMMLVR